mgnify:CR=1 FL=1
MKRIITFSSLFILFTLFFAQPAFAEEKKKGTITADYLFYNYESNQIIAWGNVSVTYDKIKISAESVLYYHEANLLIAEGNVQVDDDGNYISAEKFIYDVKNDAGIIYPLTAKITDEELKSPLFLRGGGMMYNEKRYIFENVKATSCELEKPHYTLEAKRIEWYIEDRLVLYSIVYREGSVPLFYFPYIVINLNDEESKFEMPKLGRDQYGMFLLISYMYYLNKNNQGKILLDIHETRGMGAGIEHTSKLSRNLTAKWLAYYQFTYEQFKFQLEMNGNPFWDNWWGNIKVLHFDDDNGMYLQNNQNFTLNLQGGFGESRGNFLTDINWQNGLLYNAKWNTNWQNCRIGSALLGWGLSYLKEDIRRRDYYDYNWSLDRKWTQDSFSWKERHTYDVYEDKKIESDSYIAQFLAPSFSLSWGYNLNNMIGSFTENSIMKNFTITKNWANVNSLRISYNHNLLYKVYDSQIDKTETWVEPDLNYARSNLNFGKIGIFTADFGYKHEERDTINTSGYSYVEYDSCYTGLRRNKSEKKYGSFTFSWEPEWQGQFITDGRRSWWWKNIYGLHWQIFHPFRTGVIVYTKNGSGNTPEILQEGPVGSWYLNCNFNKVSLDMQTKYDWRKKQSDPLSMQFKAQNKEHELSVKAAYFMQEQMALNYVGRWRDAAFDWKWNHARWATTTGLIYNGFKGVWEKKLDLDWKLSSQWQIQYHLLQSLNELSTNEKNRLMLTYRWHCRDIKFEYDFIQDIFTLSIRITAF